MSDLRAKMKSSMAIGVCLLVMVPGLPKRKHKTPPPSSFKPVNVYDPARDPKKDLQDALAEAAKSNRRILLQIGGDWDMWCQIMDHVFQSHPNLEKLRDTHYVWVKVNVSKENENAEFLSHYPRVDNYPHFFVLDSKGALFHSQRMKPFENGKSYNVSKVSAFLKKWEPESWWGRNPDPPEAPGKSQHLR